ncbi:uncharacterized protein LOC110038630 [Phalaenopsis equestris]|uniref:uncharacterized protein LOC110038630 n=1 Tax=Phalaenopsis equestris TaxID=78828 RepID=UPI0009E4C6A3|nr:uncharacterized protein LOC110038630 [Phalaenopsis equestris]
MGGDMNTKDYHACIKYRRKCNSIHIIQDVDGNWINDCKGIARNAVNFFQDLLTDSQSTPIHVDPQFIQQELNYTKELQLASMPTDFEVWEALKSIDSSKVAGTNGYTAAFYKKAWTIIKEEVVAAIHCFFQGTPLPNYFSSSSYVLIHKTAGSNNWNQYRPIIHTFFFNKIISEAFVSLDLLMAGIVQAFVLEVAGGSPIQAHGKVTMGLSIVYQGAPMTRFSGSRWKPSEGIGGKASDPEDGTLGKADSSEGRDEQSSDNL